MGLPALFLYLFISLGHSSPTATQQSYAIDTTYSGSSFFNGWDFFTGQDPNNGFVTYVSEAEAMSEGLITQAAGHPMYMGVDYNSTLSPSGAGRKSVRITSQKSWTHGLFIADILHMPDSICGTWPALWLLGPNWPNNGEIDIMEGINRNTHNLMSLHSGANCSMTPGEQYGSSHSMNCDGSTNGDSGCGVGANNSAQNTFGTPFSHHSGGVYATEWSSNYIKIWFFPRGSIPGDITSGKPNPNSWGLPQSDFEGASGCNIDTHFAQMSLVINTNFCGDWAGNSFNSDSVCKGMASSCANYVAGNPSAFELSYWQIYSVKVYQLQ